VEFFRDAPKSNVFADLLAILSCPAARSQSSSNSVDASLNLSWLLFHALPIHLNALPHRAASLIVCADFKDHSIADSVAFAKQHLFATTSEHVIVFVQLKDIGSRAVVLSRSKIVAFCRSKELVFVSWLRKLQESMLSLAGNAAFELKLISHNERRFLRPTVPFDETSHEHDALLEWFSFQEYGAHQWNTAFDNVDLIRSSLCKVLEALHSFASSYPLMLEKLASESFDDFVVERELCQCTAIVCNTKSLLETRTLFSLQNVDAVRIDVKKLFDTARKTMDNELDRIAPQDEISALDFITDVHRIFEETEWSVCRNVLLKATSVVAHGASAVRRRANQSVCEILRRSKRFFYFDDQVVQPNQWILPVLQTC